MGLIQLCCRSSIFYSDIIFPYSKCTLRSANTNAGIRNALMLQHYKHIEGKTHVPSSRKFSSESALLFDVGQLESFFKNGQKSNLITIITNCFTALPTGARQEDDSIVYQAKNKSRYSLYPSVQTI